MKVGDFFDFLPPELLLKIAYLLSVEDAIRCLLVNRRWNSLFTSLEPYWRAACVRLGLPSHLIERELHDRDACDDGEAHRTRYSCSKDLIVALRRHRHALTSVPPSHLVLSPAGYPLDVHYSHHHARGRCLVGTAYKNFKPTETVVEVVGRCSTERTHSLAATQHSAENRVVWAHLSSDLQLLVFVTARGTWNCYRLSTDTCVSRWQGQPMYDSVSDVQIGCCDLCLTVMMVRLVAPRPVRNSSVREPSFWDIKVWCNLRQHSDSTELEPPRVLRCTVQTNISNLTPRLASAGKKKVVLFPATTNSTTSKTHNHNTDGRSTVNGCCCCHNVLLQWFNTVTLHSLTLDTQSGTLTKTPLHTFDICCSDLENSITRGAGLNTAFVLSSDSQLLGLVFKSRLHVWGLRGHEKLSDARIGGTGVRHSHESIRLVALGHLYSLIGLEFHGSLLVVSTITGEVITQLSGFAHRHCHMLPPYIEFMSAVQEEWLNDMSYNCSREYPAVLLWNKTNRCIEGIKLGQTKSSMASHEEPLIPLTRTFLPAKKKPLESKICDLLDIVLFNGALTTWIPHASVGYLVQSLAGHR